MSSHDVIFLALLAAALVVAAAVYFALNPRASTPRGRMFSGCFLALGALSLVSAGEDLFHDGRTSVVEAVFRLVLSVAVAAGGVQFMLTNRR